MAQVQVSEVALLGGDHDDGAAGCPYGREGVRRAGQHRGRGDRVARVQRPVPVDGVGYLVGRVPVGQLVLERWTEAPYGRGGVDRYPVGEAERPERGEDARPGV